MSVKLLNKDMLGEVLIITIIPCPVWQTTYLTHAYAWDINANVWRVKECDIQMCIKAVLTKQTHQNAKGHPQTAMWVGLTLAQRREDSTDAGPMLSQRTLLYGLRRVCQINRARQMKPLSHHLTVLLNIVARATQLLHKLWLAKRISRCFLSTHTSLQGNF